ncbi:MAG: phosphatase PAP2 family protein [Actinomycetota bacterium]|nr:phosphatase PAP2 family protein [Actinomycetota bacterium]
MTGPATSRRMERARGIDHRALVAGASVVGLAASYVVAVQDPVPGWELDLTGSINELPDGVATVLYPIMQLGTLAGPIAVAAAIAWFRRDRLLAGATVVAGFVTWFGAKGVKKVVLRDRPGSFLPDIVIREGDGTGLGYVSGHAAVAACAATLAAAVLPRRWRPVAAVAAGLVGVARIVHGVHLPADVIGGWSFGVLIGLGTVELVELVDRRLLRRPLEDTAG